MDFGDLRFIPSGERRKMKDKMKKTEIMTLWLNRGLVEKTRAKAAKQGKTFDQFVNEALKKWLEGSSS